MASADSSIPPHNLPHFRIERFSRSERYTPPPAGRPDAEPANQRQAQGERLSREFSRAYDAARQRVGAQLVNARRKQSGIYVEIQSVPGQPIPELTWMRKGVRLGAVRQTENNAQIASVFIPDASREFISESIQSYGFGETPGGNVPLRDRFENLAEIRPASLGNLWTDSRALPGDPEEALWWECWTWRDQLEELQSIATQIGFILSDRTLQFPDILIQPLHGSLSQLELLIDNTSAVEQLRYASDSPVFFTTTVRREQGAWVNNLAERLTLHEADSPAVCLLDTGVARAHPLLSGSLAERDCLTVQDAWGSDDHDGHGTNMSGSILFADLTGPLSDAAEVHIPFLLESVKILPHRVQSQMDQRATERSPSLRSLLQKLTHLIVSEPFAWQSATLMFQVSCHPAGVLRSIRYAQVQ